MAWTNMLLVICEAGGCDGVLLNETVKLVQLHFEG